MSECQIELRNAGKAYPRTCETCGLFGQCKKGLSQYVDSGRREQSIHDRIVALEAENARLREALTNISNLETERAVDWVVQAGHIADAALESEARP